MGWVLLLIVIGQFKFGVGRCVHAMVCVWCITGDHVRAGFAQFKNALVGDIGLVPRRGGEVVLTQLTSPSMSGLYKRTVAACQCKGLKRAMVAVPAMTAARQSGQGTGLRNAMEVVPAMTAAMDVGQGNGLKNATAAHGDSPKTAMAPVPATTRPATKRPSEPMSKCVHTIIRLLGLHAVFRCCVLAPTRTAGILVQHRLLFVN